MYSVFWKHADYGYATPLPWTSELPAPFLYGSMARELFVWHRIEMSVLQSPAANQGSGLLLHAS